MFCWLGEGQPQLRTPFFFGSYEEINNVPPRVPHNEKIQYGVCRHILAKSQPRSTRDGKQYPSKGDEENYSLRSSTTTTRSSTTDYSYYTPITMDIHHGSPNRASIEMDSSTLNDTNNNYHNMDHHVDNNVDTISASCLDTTASPRVESFRIEEDMNRHSSSIFMHPLETASAASRGSNVMTTIEEEEVVVEEERNHGCCSWYWKDCVWPGLGLFGESYLLFSIGTIQPIWEILFEECFNEDCSPSMLAALHYSVVWGVITGMLLIGYTSKFTGRRIASLTTALFMATGAIGLTVTSLFLTENQETLVRSMVFFWFVFGFGVGGEYPMAASQASENAASSNSCIVKERHQYHPQQQEHQQHQQQQQSELNRQEEFEQEPKTEMRLPFVSTELDDLDDEQEEVQINVISNQRNFSQSCLGSQVQLVFSMQGLGILFNSLTMSALLVITLHYIDRLEEENRNYQNSRNDDDNDDASSGESDANNRSLYGKHPLHDISSETTASLLSIWRATYAFGVLILVCVWYSRYLYLKESKVWLDHKLEKPTTTTAATSPRETHVSQLVYRTPSPPKATNQEQNPLTTEAQQQQQRQEQQEQQQQTDLQGTAVPSVSFDDTEGNHIAALSGYNAMVSGINNEALSPPVQRHDGRETYPSTTMRTKSREFGTRDLLRTKSRESSTRDLMRTKSRESSARDLVRTKSREAGVRDIVRTKSRESLAREGGVGLAHSVVPSVSLVSSVSSLSSPSVLALNKIGDDETYYNFMPDAGQEACGPAFKWTLLYRLYGVRLFGVSACWLLWDIAFYGNKLFQSAFLLAMIRRGSVNDENNDDGDDNNNADKDDTTLQSLLNFSLCATLNAAVAFMGYIVAAFLVDIPAIGRWRLQLWGLIVTGILFVACGFLLDQMSSSQSGLVVLLYLGTSFFGQVGPNCTTFLIPAEIFPTEIRTFCHGIAASCGKLGALFAAIMFNHTKSDLDMFLFSGYASLIAGAVTFWTIPESLGLPLEELDHKWRLMMANKPYHGPANQARYLSLYERNQIATETQIGDRTTTASNTTTPTMDYRPEVDVF